MQRFFSTFSQLLQLFPHLEFKRAVHQQARHEAASASLAPTSWCT